MKIDKKKLQETLTPIQYHVTCEHGTEKPFTGEYVYNKEKGVYECVVCANPLFSSNTKYESGTGWPSFYDVMNSKSLKQIKDSTLGMERIEIVCAKCGAHIGHVFPDGPNPTGLRYCTNSAALKFKKA